MSPNLRLAAGAAFLALGSALPLRAVFIRARAPGWDTGRPLQTPARR